MGDLISRQAAIDAAMEELDGGTPYDIPNKITALPSAQPEIIHCKDCKFFSHGYCRFHDAKFVRPDGYCYWGGQKEGEQHD